MQVAALQRLAMAGEEDAVATLELAVPPYDASSVLKPSRAGTAPAQTPVQPGARVGLGVAGILRRLRLWTKEDGEAGRIVLEKKTVLSWTKRVTRRVLAARVGQSPRGFPLPTRTCTALLSCLLALHPSHIDARPILQAAGRA